MSDFPFDAVREISRQRAAKIEGMHGSVLTNYAFGEERHIVAILRPRWMPQRVFRWLFRQCIHVEAKQ